MSATDIVAYTYEADVHCLDCARARFVGVTMAAGEELDEHGIALSATDNEGNPVHPVFAVNLGEFNEPCCGTRCVTIES